MALDTLGWFSKIAELIKSPIKMITCLWIFTGGCLFLPMPILERLYLKDIVLKYSSFVGITFLVTTIYLCLEFGSWGYNKYKISQVKRQQKQMAIKAVQSLDSQELAVLREFTIQAQNTLNLPVMEPVVAGLFKKHILQQVGELGEQTVLGPVFSFKISDAVEELITPERVGLSRLPDESLRIWISENRPPFIATLEGRNSLKHSIWRNMPYR